MRRRNIFYMETGGTIGMSGGEDGLNVNSESQNLVFDMVNKVPFVDYQKVPVNLDGDSSDHSREGLVEFGRTALEYADQKDGIVVSYGSDTSNLAAATLALMGVERWKYPLVLMASMKNPGDRDSDAFDNALTATIFAAYGNGSGVFQNRQDGMIITSRHDTPGGSADWHTRGSTQDSTGYFAIVDLDNLRRSWANGKVQITFDTTKRKHYSRIGSLEKLITHQRNFNDGTLDFADVTPVGSRGRLPPVCLGFAEGTLGKFRGEIEGGLEPEYHHETNMVKTIRDLVFSREPGDIFKTVSPQKEGHSLRTYQGTRFVGRAIPYFSLIEIVRRGRKGGSEGPHEHWEGALSILLKEDLNFSHGLSREITDFWGRYSGINNDNLDFIGIDDFRASTDPNLKLRQIRAEPPKGIIIQATGSAGLRLSCPGESYVPLLEHCREQEIPVVLTSSSSGEVTSFEYPPALRLLKDDLVFFGGTMDSDLASPRMALLNAEPNRTFLGGLVSSLDVDENLKREVRRNIQRQLLSGNHYRNSDPSERMSDRRRVEELYGLETRADLLSAVHAKKAILASYLHETRRRSIPVPEKIVGLLK